MSSTTTDLLIYLLAIIIYLAPISLVINSKKCRGQEKNMWLLVTLLFSWLGWLLFISTVKSSKSVNKKR
ncbi:hypothetical protein C2869_09045 [Saccharobesus litoralis]|uniref:Superinfection immunity protein n=1 Tax=Saccharobesus litoralis TaxID=2172099 RepID=A0A2S0VQS6_9ALTE|nr:hypothetical protein C2869_09045 [Saccharobesus litoralis]